VAIRMRVIRIPKFLSRIVAGLLGLFGWRAHPTTR